MPMLAETKISPPVPTGIGALPGVGDALGDGDRLGLGLDLAADDELVAAEPRDGVRAADDVLQAAAERDQQLVAGLVAERVVDRLELVDVEQQHRDVALRALRAGERLADAVVEERAVRQAGQRVVERLVADARLALVAVERGGEEVGHRLQPVRVVLAERADARRVHDDGPEGAGAPADRGRGGAADAALAQHAAVEAALAGPLPDVDGLVAGDDPAGQQAVRGGQVLGVGVGVDARAGAGGEADAAAALDELDDRAVGDVEGPGDERDGLVEQRLAVRDAQGHAAEAAHRGLALGALGLGGGAAGLELGALVLDAQALAVGGAQLAREAVHHRADDDERRDRDEPLVEVGADDRVGVDEVVHADEQQAGERALEDGVTQAEDERVRRGPQEQVGEAVAGRVADEAQRGDEDGGEGRAGP